MAAVRRNINRFRKVYPGIIKTPRYETDFKGVIETKILTIDNKDSIIFTYASNYITTPAVVASPLQTSSSTSADVNVFITAISSTSVTFGFSATFSGKLNIHIIDTNNA